MQYQLPLLYTVFECSGADEVELEKTIRLLHSRREMLIVWTGRDEGTRTRNWDALRLVG